MRSQHFYFPARERNVAVPETSRTALVTGAARRVGRAIALELARAGLDVIVHYRTSHEEAEAVVEEIVKIDRRAWAIPGDLSLPESWPSVVGQSVAKAGRLDVLVNNASVFPTDLPDTLESMDVVHWERLLRTNLLAPVGLTRAAAPHLSVRGRGVVVNLLDISTLRPWPSHLGYCVSKGALETATLAMARALAPAVRVNGVAPGIAEFPESYDAELRTRLTARVPLGRAGVAEDIARGVRFLVECGDYITGRVLRIDGGRSLA